MNLLPSSTVESKNNDNFGVSKKRWTYYSIFKRSFSRNSEWNLFKEILPVAPSLATIKGNDRANLLQFGWQWYLIGLEVLWNN